MSKKQPSYDIIIIGAGPAGLSFARSLADTDLKIVLLERLSADVLANPPRDGRDIALTHLSADILKELDIWQRFPEDTVSMIKEARVIDGEDFGSFLGFDHRETDKETLGYLVSNHLIRKAAYESVQNFDTVTILTETEVTGVETNSLSGRVTLSDDTVLEAPLVIAADSRFSSARRKMGISASMLDFGRTVIVCNMEHETPHGQMAYECFGYDRTLAVLPLHGNTSSIVITVSSDEADDIMNMSEDAFNADISARFDHRLGNMSLVGERYPYPLVATYARHFVETRFALMGDAAVGMHPVTAHGYNLGLRGADTLAQQIKYAIASGADIGMDSVLKPYQAKHRRATWPLYEGTNLLVRLFTKDTPRARFVRKTMLKLGKHLPPVKKLITNQLTESEKFRA